MNRQPSAAAETCSPTAVGIPYWAATFPQCADCEALAMIGAGRDAAGCARGELRGLTEYLARTCFPESAVPQATADLVDVAAMAAPGCRSAGRSPAEAAAGQGAFWQMHDAVFADRGRLEDRHVWTRAERVDVDVGRFELIDVRTRCAAASETTSGVG